MSLKTFAAISVGSFELTMKIFEFSGKNTIREIDFLSQNIDLGSETYATGKLSKEKIDELCRTLLDFKQGGLIFNYDLLGYGMMALSTFFLGFSMKAKGKADRWLKRLLMIHGVFFPGCFLLPMTGIFLSMGGETGRGGTVALVIWCVYFLPIGILAYRHFS